MGNGRKFISHDLYSFPDIFRALTSKHWGVAWVGLAQNENIILMGKSLQRRLWQENKADITMNLTETGYCDGVWIGINMLKTGSNGRVFQVINVEPSGSSTRELVKQSPISTVSVLTGK